MDESEHEIRWRVEALDLGNSEAPAFEVLTRCTPEDPFIVFPAKDIQAFGDQSNNSDLKISKHTADLHRPDLNTSGWDFIRRTILSIKNAFSQPNGAQSLPDAFDPRRIRKSLDVLLRSLLDASAVLRFDAVKLHSERSISGYEHLWICLENASYGPRRWQRFEFRLGAALVKKGIFSTHPRLEFPIVRGEHRQLDNWFEECEDGLGPKFELRFELKSGALDLRAWEALTDEDQALMASLIERLPTILGSPESAGMKITRRWQDWLVLVMGMQRILWGHTHQQPPVTECIGL